jgi:hypothetical protein
LLPATNLAYRQWFFKAVCESGKKLQDAIDSISITISLESIKNGNPAVNALADEKHENHCLQPLMEEANLWHTHCIFIDSDSMRQWPQTRGEYLNDAIR